MASVCGWSKSPSKISFCALYKNTEKPTGERPDLEGVRGDHVAKAEGVPVLRERGPVGRALERREQCQAFIQQRAPEYKVISWGFNQVTVITRKHNFFRSLKMLALVEYILQVNY